MNYRHAFHAGNHGDVLKHAVLMLCLEHLRRKPTPFAVLDTHAGAGIYDLEGEAAARGGEWRGGIGRLWGAPPPPGLGPLLEAVRAINRDSGQRFYPGSPALIASLLRAGDRLAACELHPEEEALLRTHFLNDPRVQVHARDGWDALTALLPPPERRGLVLIDPPYEAPGELERAPAAIAKALSRFGHGVVLWWRPLKSASSVAAADGELLARTNAPMLRADLAVSAPDASTRLAASSVLLVNPPFGLEAALTSLLPPLRERLEAGPGAYWRVSTPKR